MANVVEMQNITKAFPGIIANDNVTFDLRQGEIHALLGENGAGKSTLMSILFGMYRPDSGSISVYGRKEDIANPNIATALGIGMVHQHFKLVDNFTVTENIILGLEPLNKFKQVNLKEGREKVVALSHQYGLNIDPDAKIEDISVGMQQRVEILKMLYRNANILIFDEPTAVLTPQEIKELMQIMKDLIREGKSIILITHKLKEIKQAADRCTVLRRGRLISTVDVALTSEKEMAEMMVGREVNMNVVKGHNQRKEIVLSIRDLHVKDNRGIAAVKGIDLDCYAGEITCIAGIEGNGQLELIEAITGLRPIVSGSITLNGKDISHEKIRRRTNTGISYVPEDRHRFGLVLDMTLKENMILQSYYQKPFSNHGILEPKAIFEYATRLSTDFDVRSGKGPDTIVRSMSGGNQQKAILAREIDRSPDLLIVFQPTRGLDVGAIEYIHRRIVEERDKGKAVLLVSYELDEVIDLSDIISVVYEGNIVGTVRGEDATENELGVMMAGSKRGEA